MSFLPLLFEDSYSYPSTMRRLFNIQNSEDLFSPFRISEAVKELRKLRNELAEFKKDDSISIEKDIRFQANVDVQQFKPEEITVKLTDNTVTVEAKHQEKQDEHGFISTHLVRRYILPEDCDVNQLQSKLSSDGVLSVTAPKKPEVKRLQYKQIPIIKTEKPIKKSKLKRGEGDAQRK